MKSQRYQILPRLRLYSSGMYVCVWRDPGNLIQRRGEPLRYVHAYTGYGETPDVAIRNCQNQILCKRAREDHFNKEIDRLVRAVESPSIPLFCETKVPDHCLATSNLPWWKRLFRV